MEKNHLSVLVKEIIANKTLEEAISFWHQHALELIPFIDFRNPSLLFKAFIHKSFENENDLIDFNYERLEFLGDAILQSWVTIKLIDLFDKNEGELSVMRSAIVNEKTLARIALTFDFDKLVLIGKGELRDQGHLKESILSDIFEAFLGAEYQDKKDMNKIYILLDKMNEKLKADGINLFDLNFSDNFDPKTKLQNEVMKELGVIPLYPLKELDNETYKYEVSLVIKDKLIFSQKTNSIKETEKEFAKKALEEKPYARNLC